MIDSDAIQTAIKDCGLPGRLVDVQGRLITIEMLNDRNEQLERVQLGSSEFCDLLLDWREKTLRRQAARATAAPRAAERELAAASTA